MTLKKSSFLVVFAHKKRKKTRKDQKEIVKKRSFLHAGQTKKIQIFKEQSSSLFISVFCLLFHITHLSLIYTILLPFVYAGYIYK